MNRGYKNYEEVEPYNDGWGYTAPSGTSYSDHACRPVIVDADGKKHPIIQYASGTGGYVMKTERIVEYRYSPDEPLADHRRYEQHSPAYDRPEKVENFLTKVQDDASRPVTKVSVPIISNWRANPNSAGKDHGTGTKNKDMYYERPGSNHRPITPSHPPSKPTNDIGTAVDFLAEAIKPNYGTNSQTDVSRPNKAGPLSINWRTGLNSADQDRKMDSDEDEQRMYGKNQIPNFREPTKPINNKEGYERANGNGSPTYFGQNPAPFRATSQQPRFPAPTMQNKEMYSAPEKIDSTEARRRYGNMKYQPVLEDSQTETIDSDAALKKYKGAKVPW
ncbi:unnamed protein product [Coffea canephora]|uniref:Uncharacterized protein n=1 Tax=Coffea canephora TaxID=49390 RepID=A0A068UJ90_COFCA|nr:unnamed protein product [Coffea canephora]